jgi:hypothetical protein
MSYEKNRYYYHSDPSSYYNEEDYFDDYDEEDNGDNFFSGELYRRVPYEGNGRVIIMDSVDVNKLINLPNNITELVYEVDEPLPINVCPNSIKTIAINSPTENITALIQANRGNGCPNITRIIFGDLFNGNISPLRGCPNVEHIEFGLLFNQSIAVFTVLKQLEYLSFGDEFNQSIESLKGCTKLKTLKFGEHFNKDILPLHGCVSLECVEFGENFDQPLFALKKLPKLREIVLHKSYRGNTKGFNTNVVSFYE